MYTVFFLIQVLTGQPPPERTKIYLEEVEAGTGETGDLLDGLGVGGDYHPQPHHTTSSHIQVVAGPDQDHSHYTHVTQLPEGQVSPPSCSDELFKKPGDWHFHWAFFLIPLLAIIHEML